MNTVNSNKQVLLSVLGIAIVIVLVTGITYSFFNYTRTGSSNTIRVGRISFVSKNEQTITLNNLFPIDPTETGIMNDNTKVGIYQIAIQGDTDYIDGIEYLVSTTNTNISTNQGQILPISLDITVSGLGTSSDSYFTTRDNTNESIYKKLVGSTLSGNQMLLVGYIKPNTTSGTAEGVNGTITVKAYLDKNKILVSDTYDGSESDNMGTTNNQAQGKTVLTTAEWNAIASSGASFKVKVEANEGIWVTGSLEEIMHTNNIGIDTQNGVDFSKTSTQDNTNGVYVRAGTENDEYPIMYYRGPVTNNNVVFNNYCWQTIRTTDTGGVKLIYNGLPTMIYSPVNPLSQTKYTNITTPLREFTFDSSDNSWNVTITNEINPTIAFKVPAGSDYSLVFTGTTGATTGGSYYIYKNSTSVYSANGGGGQSYNYTHSFGTLSSNDIIEVYFVGYGTIEYPITLKIVMKQNSISLPESSYTLVGEAFTYNSSTSKWSSTVDKSMNSSMEFKVSEAGDYLLNFTNPGSGSIDIYRDGNYIRTSSGVSYVTLFNLQPTEKIKIFYSNYNSNVAVNFDFYVSKYEARATCDNTSTNRIIKISDDYTFKYNATSGASPTYVGYMYGNAYTYSTGSWTNGAYFGSGFTWDGTNYKLVNANTTTPDATHHYSCNSTDPNGTCNSIRYVYWINGDSKYYILISGGKGINEAITDMNQNLNDSTAKSTIDSWYSTNMTNVTNKLEDTIWCNDRSIAKANGWSVNGSVTGSSSEYREYSILYGAHERSNYSTTAQTINKPNLTCSNKNDSFTVSNRKGNTALDYPVAMLTADEAVLAGGVAGKNTNSYLFSAYYFYTMSPINYSSNGARIFTIDDAEIGGGIVTTLLGIRPSISIKPGILVSRGTGTALDPYVIE